MDVAVFLGGWMRAHIEPPKKFAAHFLQTLIQKPFCLLYYSKLIAICNCSLPAKNLSALIEVLVNLKLFAFTIRYAQLIFLYLFTISHYNFLYN